MTLLATEEYVEAGYLLDDDYVGGIASGEADTTTTYVEEGYIVDDYFRPGGGGFTIFADLTQAIEEGSATLNSTTTISATSTKILSGGASISCSSTANISGNIIKGVSATFGVVALIGHEENGGIGSNVDPSVVFDSGAQLDSTATMSTTAGKISQLDVNISGAFAATMNVIATMSGDVLMQAAVSMSCDADKIADIGGLLEYFANLNAAAAATIGATATVNTNISLDISPDVILQGASEVVSTTLLQVFEPGVRPHVPTDINSAPAFSTFTVAQGTHSLIIDGDDTLSQNQYVEYTLKDTDLSLSNKSTSAFHFEAWIRGSTFIDAWAGDRASGDKPLWRLATNTQGAFFYTSQTQNNTNAERLSGGDYDSSTFNHIAVRIENNSAAIWIDGVRNDSYTSMTTTAGTSVMYLTIGQNEQYLTPSNFGNSYVDELRILRGTPSELDTATGYSTSDTSITVPTSANVNDVNTKILLHLDGNYLDDDSGVKEYLATINSAASLTSDAARIVEGNSSINTIAGFSSAVTRVRSADGTLASSTTATATGERIKSGVATLASAFGVSSSASRTRGADGDFAVSADLNSVVGIIHQGQVSVNAFVTTLTAAGRVGDYFVNADINSTFTTDAVVVRGGVSSINSEFNTTANPNRLLGIGATINSASSLSSSLSTILGHTANINSACSLTSGVGKIHPGSALVNSSATLSATASRLTVEVANYGAQFGINVSGNTISDGAATTLTTASINTNGGVVADGGATLNGFFAVLSVNKILHVDEFVYKIPAETRVYKIINETRSFKIDTETRSYKIKGAA